MKSLHEAPRLQRWRSHYHLARIIRPTSFRAWAFHKAPEMGQSLSNATLWAWLVIVLAISLAAGYLLWARLSGGG